MVNYNFVALPKIYRFLTGNELKVFVTIFDQWSQMKNEDGWYYRSQKQLCEDTGLTDRTLRDIIKKFVEKGVIFTTTYNDGVKMATYNKANEYKINMEKVVEMSEKKDVKLTTYSEEKVVKNTIEGGKNYAPYKNKENKNNISKDFSTYGNSTCRENKKIKNINMKKSNSVKSNVDNIIQSDDVNNINSGELFNLNGNVDMSDEVCVLDDDFNFNIWISKWDALKGEVLEANRNNNIEQFKRSLNDMLDCLSELKLKGNRYYDYNCKDAISFVNSNSVVFDGDFLFAGGDFRRSVERRA